MVASFVALRYEALKAFRTDDSYAVLIARTAVVIDRKRCARGSHTQLTADRPLSMRENAS
jgi:hypothetical protein